MKHLFIVNPAAGKCDRSVQIKKLVRQVYGSRGLDWDVHISRQPGDCTRLAREAAQRTDALRIYACGGDGTLNEVVNGIIGFDHVSVSHFPSGSGNDFVKLFDHPEAFRDLERFLDCQETHFDLIRCTNGDSVHYANNICSVGLDARIGTEISRYRRLPFLSGKGAYYASTLVNILKGIRRPFRLEINGQVISGDQTLICVCSGRCYGSSFHPVPDAQPDDGLLDVLVVAPVSLSRLAAVIGKYQRGLYAQYPDLIQHFRTAEIRIQSPEESIVNIDGEILRSQDTTFSVVPQSLRFFYPAGLTYRSEAVSKEKFPIL